ncbi:alpha/beta hydrolase [Methylovirgula ligni]|uniref:Pimeloyl-ACP methyl ester carboxylesterase n=1 Tax=Methylovirgula ligni TaxID=569860 RepID=A0A3D9YVQ6_9HYPH|nr:alpha/beta hydrolase [Methylovirgula ligni]QAY96047.1 alpha/beta hydrolase [Methylovirgula ligni]REF86278.1 pimeloyl-ACP methyl ester carboxylesterase [Methylovirgula ligni]
MTRTQSAYVDWFVSAQDGLRLHLRDYGSPLDPGLPVVCLPGLARNGADFGPLAEALAAGAAGQKRRVIAVDYRGRGESDYDADWRHYDLAFENADIQAQLAAVEIHEAIFIGTSRGGLHAMLLAAARLALVRGVVLNDVGPVIELQGLSRIRQYLRYPAAPNSLADAIDYVRKTMSAHFPALSEAEIEAYARASFQKPGGTFGATFDPKLVKPLEALRLDEPPPDCWRLFEALADVPLLAIRGGNSDLLSPETFVEMTRRHRNCATYVVEGQGHPPLLMDDAAIARICTFVAEAEMA